jgi:hypothetical protein
MNATNPQLQLHLSICLRCHALPVKNLSWEPTGHTVSQYCRFCQTQGKESEMIYMNIAIPVSLLNDQAYSEVALHLAMDG